MGAVFQITWKKEKVMCLYISIVKFHILRDIHERSYNVPAFPHHMSVIADICFESISHAKSVILLWVYFLKTWEKSEKIYTKIHKDIVPLLLPVFSPCIIWVDFPCVAWLVLSVYMWFFRVTSVRNTAATVTTKRLEHLCIGLTADGGMHTCLYKCIFSGMYLVYNNTL